ncbi:unnamed protein product, partial [Rotaria sordida]
EVIDKTTDPVGNRCLHQKDFCSNSTDMCDENGSYCSANGPHHLFFANVFKYFYFRS